MVAAVCFALVFIVAGTVIVAMLINKRKKKKGRFDKSIVGAAVGST